MRLQINTINGEVVEVSLGDLSRALTPEQLTVILYNYVLKHGQTATVSGIQVGRVISKSNDDVARMRMTEFCDGLLDELR